MTNYTVAKHECTQGCYIENLRAVYNEETEETVCPRCGAPAEYVGERPADYVCVAAFDTHRAYGGPEEGGWYYTVGTRVDETLRCFIAGDTPQIEEYVQTLKRRYPILEIRIYEERVAPSTFPAQRPYYC